MRYICSLQQEDRLLQFEEEKVRKYDLQEDSSSVSLSYLAHLNLSSIASTQGKISLTARSNRLIFLAIKNCFTLASCMIKSIKFLLPTLDKRKVNSKLKFCTGKSGHSIPLADPGQGPGRSGILPPPPHRVIFGPNWGPEGRKKNFKTTPPQLSQGLDDWAPPPTPPPIWRSGSATVFNSLILFAKLSLWYTSGKTNSGRGMHGEGAQSFKGWS